MEVQKLKAPISQIIFTDSLNLAVSHVDLSRSLVSLHYVEIEKAEFLAHNTILVLGLGPSSLDIKNLRVSGTKTI
jgi:hypothetical protein